VLKLFIFTQNGDFKVRRVPPKEKWENYLTWQNIQFKIHPDDKLMITWSNFLPDLLPEEARDLVEFIGARFPISENFQSLYRVCPEVCFLPDDKEWVFYGGSFNPWHAGHQACLDLLPKEKLCLIIPDRNPFKELELSDPIASLIELSTKIRPQTKQYLTPSFLIIHQKNPTIDWIENTKKNLKGVKLSLLIGFDSFAQIMKWTRSQELLSQLDTLYVVSRLEEESTRLEAEVPVKNTAPDLKIIFLGRHQHENVSSTIIRNQK
jgi:nicotinate (nicotinamide) nucleotide adenylyltransferase